MPDAPKNRYWGRKTPEPVTAVLAEASGKTAVMRIMDPIDSWGAPYGVSAKDFNAALDSLDDSIDTIELHLHSPGGDAFEGVAILNALRQHPAKVNVIVDGLAASAASVVAMAGDTVSMAPSSELMVHDASALVIGQACDMKTAAAMLDSVSDSYAAAYAAKAGGTVADWRAAMQPESWYKADEAVAAGLADEVLTDAAPAQPKTRFDLSIFAHAGRDHAPAPAFPAKAHKTPAEPPEKHPTTEEAVTMTETEIKALRERLGLAEDADEATVTAAAVAHALADKPDDLSTDAVLAAVAKLGPDDAKKIVDALGTTDEPTIPDGKVLVSETLLDELRANATLGAEARAAQLETERDEAIEAAFKAGKISAARRDTWRNAWDKDPEGAKADLDSLEARFPVSKPNGYAGSDATDGDGTKPFTDDEAAALAQLGGVSKEALLHG